MNKYYHFICILFIFVNCIANASASPVLANHGMVVTSQHLATQVGVDILKRGGNAVDAAVGVGYALAVTDPCCGNIGGGGFMLIHFANGKNTFIDFRETAPLLASSASFLDKDKKPNTSLLDKGYLSVAVPGTVYGLNTALKQYGTWSLKTTIVPAIALAKNGFILQAGDIENLKKENDTFKTEPNVAAIFLKQDQPYKTGDVLVQKDLAKTLEEIAQKGKKVFYEGSIAEKIVKASKEHEGFITSKDLANYHSKECLPIVCHYRGYEIISAPPSSAGGITLCEMLHITEAYPLKSLGYHTPLGVNYILEAMRYAYADRKTLGDPEFVSNPISTLLSKEHIQSIQQQIKPYHAGDSNKIGVVVTTNPTGNHTTHYSIVDKYGNAVAVTYTLNSFFGAKVIPDHTGFFLNNEMGDFALTPNSTANAIQPGKRPLSSMTPTIILKNKQLYLVLGAPGGPTITTQVLQVIENVIDYGMDLQTAVNLPRYHMQWFPDMVYLEPDVFSSEMLKKLKEMGYQFQMGSPYKTPTWGAVEAILRDPLTGSLYGANDSRRSAGLAKGY